MGRISEGIRPFLLPELFRLKFFYAKVKEGSLIPLGVVFDDIDDVPIPAVLFESIIAVEYDE